MLSRGDGNASWFCTQELKVCHTTDGVASYLLSEAGRGQFAQFAECLCPARVSKKISSLHKTWKFGGAVNRCQSSSSSITHHGGAVFRALNTSTSRMPLDSTYLHFSVIFYAKRAVFLSHVHLIKSKGLMDFNHSQV